MEEAMALSPVERREFLCRVSNRDGHTEYHRHALFLVVCRGAEIRGSLPCCDSSLARF